MSDLTALLLGLGLGLRHATDADHVAVVSTLLQREPSVARAAMVAVWWGAGHSAAFLAIGLAVVIVEARLPKQFETFADLLVAAMLVGVGAWHLGRNIGAQAEAARVASLSPAARLRPLMVGVVHGLAGSAGIALLATTAIASRPHAIAYLGLFALGTVFGMVVLTVALSWPLQWSVRRAGGRAGRAVGVASGLLSIALGAILALDLVLGLGPD
ncbi:MAG: hypothetical protein IAG13_20205 [Deltaproteobacteria bacterium]|nr:hypothetical protein [Nannocystaceae bacterium]